MVNAVIFDVDGTLVDSVDYHARAWQEAFRQFGYDFEFDRVRSQIGKGGDQLMPVLLSEEDIEANGEKIDAYRANVLKNKFFPLIDGFPRVRELMEALISRGSDVVLASSAKKAELGFYKMKARIDDLIHKETSSDDAEKSKPHPDILAAALELIPGVSPMDIIAVGDTPYDAEAAAKVGIRTIGLLCGGFAEEDLLKAGCMAIYRNPADLLEQLDSSPLA
jgi:HAD superfamily hydrolase (TIGR01509 family)